MMLTIWKFDLAIADKQTVDMPLGARILSVGAQFDKPRVWALVDPTKERVPHRIYIYGTGWPVGDVNWSAHIFLGTVVTAGGALVWHVFEDIA